ncbi:hypothetical protein EON65_39490 [archaeon]|nr:MAG: hypothetical protein EON65_39490 [archaeon]
MKRRHSQSSEETSYYVFKKGHWTNEEDETIRAEVMKVSWQLALQRSLLSLIVIICVILRVTASGQT